MDELLKIVIETWKKNPIYTDVDAECWEPGQPRVKTCSKGCDLIVYEMYVDPSGWRFMGDRDCWRQTRICREHGFARIYLISGNKADHYKWVPSMDVYEQP